MEETMMNEEKVASLVGATPLELAKAIATILDNKKGHEVKVLYVEDKTSVADYFVLCTGNSGTQVKALAGEAEYKTELAGVSPDRVEGRDNNSWIILDYGNVVVHIFHREAREFYNLDKLYGDTTPILEF